MEQINKTRSCTTQEAVKARAMRILNQRKMYEGQRDMYNQVAFALQGIKDAQQTEDELGFPMVLHASIRT